MFFPGLCLLGFAISPGLPRMLQSPPDVLGVFPRAAMGYLCFGAGMPHCSGGSRNTMSQGFVECQ